MFEKGRQWLREEEVARAFLLVRAQRLLLAEDVVADSPAEVAREVAGKGHVGLALQLAAQSGMGGGAMAGAAVVGGKPRGIAGDGDSADAGG